MQCDARSRMHQATDDFDLTNLNWVPGAEAPMNYSLSPPSSSTDKQAPTNQTAIECKKKRKLHVDSYGNKRPTCSYCCLIALVLKSATSKNSGACLPLPDIYSYIEELFPFYKNVEGWRNSVQHNLSMNPCFRKTLRDEGWEGKKGYFWEISPEYLENVNKELFEYLKVERMSLDKMRTKLFRKWAKPSQQQVKEKATSNHVVTPKKKKPAEVLRDPSDVALFSPEIQKQLIKKRTTPIKAKTDQTSKAFDTNSAPSEFAGIHTPQTDDIGAAKELFNCGSTSETNSPNHLYKTTNHGEIVPFSTTPMYSIYGYPPVGYGYGTPSPIMGASPASSEGMTPVIATPPFMPLVPIGMFPHYVMDVNGHPRPMYASPPCQKCGHQNSPTVPRGTCDTEDPLDDSKDNCKCKGKKGKKAAANKKPQTPKCPRKLKFNEGSLNRSPSNPPKKRGRPSKKTATSTQDSYAAVDSDSEGETEYFSALATKRKKADLYDGDTPSKKTNGLIRTISDMSLNNDLQLSSSNSSIVTQTKPFKSVPLLECLSRQNSPVNESKHIDNGGRIPALNSLLDMGDASIMGITKAMKMDQKIEHSL